MALAFFAYKRAQLRLFKISYTGLLGDKAPVFHPMGSFWLLSMVDLATMQKEGRVKVQRATCEMTFKWTGASKTSDELVAEAMSFNMKKRKLELQAEIAETQEHLESKRKELQSLTAQIGKHD